MNKQEKHAAIAKILLKANARFRYSKNFDAPFALEAWCEDLEDIPLDKLDKAMKTLSGNESFPTLGELKEAIVMEGIDILSGEEAFEKVWNGFGTKPHISDICQDTINRLGGWHTIGDQWVDYNKQGIRRNFIDVYNSAKRNFIETKQNGLKSISGSPSLELE
jgi:hypothetical protein